MTFIAEDGRRTVTNGSAFDARKVYEITASVVLDVGQSNGFGEVERTGETVTEPRVYHVVAESEALANALVFKRWGSPFQRHTFISIRPLFVIDAEVKAWSN